jgi:acetylornithine deacetylase/succinyl-diaminopimelate desuccinylase-like protein
MTDTVLTYLQDHHDRFVQELTSWLRIPSVSTFAEQAQEVRRAAAWAQEKLVAIGFPTVETIATAGHPLVYAEWLSHPDQPTLLVYGHYDVQPAEPLDEWLSPPFEPAIRDDNLYARGAVDDKGQVMLVLAALEAWSRTLGGLPINVKVLLEGEEETGGEAIEAYVRANPVRLEADAALICDTHMLSERQPLLITGLRGVLYTEIAMHGAQRDLHSGSFGGVAPNPVHALCVLIDRLKGADGVIHIPELLAALAPPPEAEKRFWEEDPLHLEELLRREMGVDELVGDAAYPPLERIWARPTLEVHGIRGGFTGQGAKTVIPAEALAKVSLRLPAGLQPDEVFAWFETAVRRHTPAGHRVEVTRLNAGEGLLVSPDTPVIRAAASALEATYGVEPAFMREGGSIPVAALFDQVLQLPVVLMGFGLPDDGPHAPNEKFSLAQFARGMATVADFLGRLQRG